MSYRPRLTSDSNITFILILFVVACAVYLNTLHNGFVYDDEFVIVNNKWIRDLAYLPEIFSSTLWGFKLGADSNYYRPFVHLVLMAEYHLFGLSAWAYHLTNAVVHSANTVLVFLIALHLLGEKEYEPQGGRAPAPYGRARLIALGAGLIFASHPVHVEAVAWAAVVADLFLTLFYFLSLYLYIKHLHTAGGAERTALLLFSLLFFFIDVFLKETAVTLIAVLFVYDLTAGGGLRLNPGSIVRAVFRYIPYLLIVSFYILIRMHFLGGFVPLKQSAYLTAFQYFLNIPPLFAEYIRVLFYPAGLNAFYSFHPVLSIRDYDFLVLTPLLLFVPAVIFLLMTYNRTALFCIFFAVLTLSPALYIPGVGVRGNAFAERYLYMPSAGFSIVMSVFIYWVLMKVRAPGVLRHRGTVFLVIIAVITAAFSVQTIRRNRVWENNYTLWKDTAAKTKDSKVVYINLGAAAGAAGRRAEAIAAYNRAIELAPYSPEIYNNIGIEYLESGRLDDALAAFKKAYTLTSNLGYLAIIRKNMGDVYLSKGMVDAAIREYTGAVRVKPYDKAVRRRLEKARELKEGLR
ncbi:MAG: tetratricopeptide repeat protein [Thermodesulfobacteriota bacterium]